ncbi:MAG: hypothetical protein R3330_05715 [Saprospiraceae bacterium]|nr:hypothetical protein [Saprospiraceae bacterium]
MHSIRYILCVIAVQFGIAGCISTTPYPDEWSPLGINTTSQCPNLTGSYENFGLSATDPADRYKPMLAEVFFPQDGPGYTVLKAVSHVTIDDQGDDGLVVKAWVGDELLVERLLIASQLPCIEGGRVYHAPSWSFVSSGSFPIPIFGAGHTSTDYLISLAANGSLVIQIKEIDIGIIMVIPVAGMGQGWYTFHRTSPETPGLHTNSNSPQGVRHGMTPAYSLLPPDGKTESSIRWDAKTCLNMESWLGVTPDQQAKALLGGRSTQAFVMQYCKDNCELQPQFRDWRRYVPATHTLRIEKMHWQPPTVADRYVICLLRKGYRWEDRGESAVGQEFAIPSRD